MKSHMGTMKISGNTDRDFAIMMIAHHEILIQMSKTELATDMNAD